MKSDRIAVFVDAENVTSWIKHGGIEVLVDELQLLGQIIVRRAYGAWSRPQLAMHQAAINQQGFEMIHCYHPVNGKNSADIQMTVDVMECAWQLPNINCFVLVTGDSDFSPVFRRLREMDKEVVGVGQASALSECVKTSCSRFIYTDEFVENKKNLLIPESAVISVSQPTENNTTEKKSPAIATPDVLPTLLSNAIKLTKQILRDEKDSVLTSQLRSKIVLLDNTFSHQILGFKKFSDFLKSIEDIELIKDGTVDFVCIKKTKIRPLASELNLEEQYRSLLNKNNVRLICVDKLKIIYKQSISLDSSFSAMTPLKDAIFIKSEIKNNQITKSDVNKSINIFVKSNFIYTETTTDGIQCIKIKKLQIKEFLLEVDNLLISTLIGLCGTCNIELKPKEIKKITLSGISKEGIKNLIDT